MVLASFISSGKQSSLQYGVGNSFLANTKTEDFKIVKCIAKKYGLQYDIMYWTTPGGV